MLRPDLQALELKVRHQVFDAGGPIERVYFPQNCLISIRTRMRDGSAFEIATVDQDQPQSEAGF